MVWDMPNRARRMLSRVLEVKSDPAQPETKQPEREPFIEAHLTTADASEFSRSLALSRGQEFSGIIALALPRLSGSVVSLHVKLHYDDGGTLEAYHERTTTPTEAQ